jgi:hypothetical protein
MEKDQHIFKEWKDMPEFVQKKQVPYKELVVRFETEKDLKNFARLIDQTVNKGTKGIWFPKLDLRIRSGLRYIDDES